MSDALITRQLPGTFGIEVETDLRKPMSPDQIAQFRQLMYRHYLLVFRNQSISNEDHVRIGRYIGPVNSDSPDTNGYISTRPGGALGTLELAFHSDLAFSPHPFKVISLYAEDVDNRTSSTRFVNNVAAYRALPDSVKRRIQNLRVLHVFPLDVAGRTPGALARNPDLPHAIHPLVWKHPVSGEPSLYVHINQTDSVVGLSPNDSEQLIQELFGYIYTSENGYEHRWNQGDIVFWDNIALTHARGDLSKAGRRHLHRVVVADKTFLEMYPQFQQKQFADLHKAS